MRLKALTDERDFPGCMSKIYQDRRDLVRDLLTKAGLSVVDQKATPFMWVQVPDGFSSQEFSDELFGVADVVVSAGRVVVVQQLPFLRGKTRGKIACPVACQNWA